MIDVCSVCMSFFVIFFFGRFRGSLSSFDPRRSCLSPESLFFSPAPLQNVSTRAVAREGGGRRTRGPLLAFQRERDDGGGRFASSRPPMPRPPPPTQKNSARRPAMPLRVVKPRETLVPSVTSKTTRVLFIQAQSIIPRAWPLLLSLRTAARVSEATSTRKKPTPSRLELPSPSSSPKFRGTNVYSCPL